MLNKNKFKNKKYHKKIKKFMKKLKIIQKLKKFALCEFNYLMFTFATMSTLTSLIN